MPRSEIDERYLDSPYYIAPNDPVGQEAFAVIREAMRGKGMVALGRVVLSKRERVIMLQPWDKGMMGTTVRYPYEVRDSKDYFYDIADVKVQPDLLQFAEHILKSKEARIRSDAIRRPLRAGRSRDPENETGRPARRQASGGQAAGAQCDQPVRRPARQRRRRQGQRAAAKPEGRRQTGQEGGQAQSRSARAAAADRRIGQGRQGGGEEARQGARAAQGGIVLRSPPGNGRRLSR